MGSDSKNQSYLALDLREKSTHTYTLPQGPVPSLDVLPTSGSVFQEVLEERQHRSRWIDKRELTGSNHFQTLCT